MASDLYTWVYLAYLAFYYLFSKRQKQKFNKNNIIYSNINYLEKGTVRQKLSEFSGQVAALCLAMLGRTWPEGKNAADKCLSRDWSGEVNSILEFALPFWAVC